MDEAIERAVARACDPELAPDERARAAHEALASPDSVRLDVTVEVVAAVAATWGADEALRVALANRGPHRREGLSVAADQRQEQGDGDTHLTVALVELGRRDEALRSLVGEFRRLLGTEALGQTLLAAWGLHLLRVFAALDDAAFDAFVYAVNDADERNAPLVAAALDATGDGGDGRALRYRFDQASEDWYLDRGA